MTGFTGSAGLLNQTEPCVIFNPQISTLTFNRNCRGNGSRGVAVD